MLTGVDQLHGLILSIQEESADGDTKGAQPLTGGHYDEFKAMDTAGCSVRVAADGLCWLLDACKFSTISDRLN